MVYGRFAGLEMHVGNFSSDMRKQERDGKIMEKRICGEGKKLATFLEMKETF